MSARCPVCGEKAACGHVDFPERADVAVALALLVEVAKAAAEDWDRIVAEHDVGSVAVQDALEALGARFPEWRQW